MISLILPTRNRPKQLSRMFDSLLKTISDVGNIEILFYVSSDDNVSFPVINKIKRVVHTKIISEGAPLSLPYQCNKLASIASGDVFLLLNDDHVFVTPAWDLIALKKLQQNPSAIVVYVFDGIQNEKLVGVSFLRREFFRIFGYLYPETYTHFYIDNWLSDITKGANAAFYCPDIIIEHMHPMVKKAKDDETYKRVADFISVDSKIYHSLSEKQNRDLAIEKLKNAWKIHN